LLAQEEVLGDQVAAVAEDRTEEAKHEKPVFKHHRQ
jgi:hypothetical protein